MERWTGYKEKDLKEAIEDVKQFAMEVNPKFLSTLKYKFQKPEYMSVAQIAFNFQWEEFWEVCILSALYPSWVYRDGSEKISR